MGRQELVKILGLQRSGRARMVRMVMGLAALLVLLARIGEDLPGKGSTAVNVLIWSTMLVTIVLLVWRERNQALANRRAGLEHDRFIAAAETSTDAFFILDAVRARSGEITD